MHTAKKFFHRRGNSHVHANVTRSSSKTDLFAFLRPAFASTHNLSSFATPKNPTATHAPSSVTTAQQDQARMMSISSAETTTNKSSNNRSGERDSGASLSGAWAATVRRTTSLSVRPSSYDHNETIRYAAPENFLIRHGEVAQRSRGRLRAQRRAVSVLLPNNRSVLQAGAQGCTQESKDMDEGRTVVVVATNLSPTDEDCEVYGGECDQVADLRTTLAAAFPRVSLYASRIPHPSLAQSEVSHSERNSVVGFPAAEPLVPATGCTIPRAVKRHSMDEAAVPAAILRQRRYAMIAGGRPTTLFDTSRHGIRRTQEVREMEQAALPEASLPEEITLAEDEGDELSVYVRTWMSKITIGEPLPDHTPWELPVLPYKPPFAARKSRFNIRHMMKSNPVQFN